MRMIGKMDNQQDATRFSDYVQTLGITVQTEPDGEEIALWNIDDDHLDQVKTELEQFRENPSDTKYVQGAAQGQKIRNQAEKEYRKREQNIIHARRGWEKPLLNQCPVTMGLIFLSILTVVFTSSTDDLFRFGDKQNELLEKMLITDVNKAMQDPGNIRIMGGYENLEFWRLFTPMFIHFNFLHILFNMMWTKDLGTVIEHRIGSLKFLLLVLLISGISNAGQFYISGSIMFGGMSGVVFGLIGFIWMRGKYDPKSGFYIPKEILVFLGIFQLLCFLGVLGPIANSAHMVGLGVGMAVGAGVPLIKKALK